MGFWMLHNGYKFISLKIMLKLYVARTFVGSMRLNWFLRVENEVGDKRDKEESLKRLFLLDYGRIYVILAYRKVVVLELKLQELVSSYFSFPPGTKCY